MKSMPENPSVSPATLTSDGLPSEKDNISTEVPEVVPQVANQKLSENHEAQSERKVEERHVRKEEVEKKIPSPEPAKQELTPEKIREIEQAQASYECQLQEYRQISAQKWLVDNQKDIGKCLGSKKAAAGAKYKLYVVINGSKQQIIPENNTLGNKEKKVVCTYIKNVLKGVVETQPDRAALEEQFSDKTKKLASSLKMLEMLGGSLKRKPVNDLSASGIRIDVCEGKPPIIHSYHLGDYEVFSTEREHNDGVQLQDVNLSSPDIEEEE